LLILAWIALSSQYQQGSKEKQVASGLIWLDKKESYFWLREAGEEKNRIEGE
jgi:hypothetical protein